MHVTVRLGEPYWRQAGRRSLDLDLPAAATVRDLLDVVASRLPDLLQAEVPPTVLLGDRIADETDALRDGDAATLIWALAGG